MGKADAKPQDITDCPDWGKGGSYTLDPRTGKRTLVERTAPAAEAAASAENAAAPPPAAVEPATVNKEA